MNLVIDIKFVYNYNIFFKFILNFIGNLLTFSNLHRRGKKQFKVF